MSLNNPCADDKNRLETEVIFSIERTLGLITAILLLTGQITIFGIFVRPGRFSLSLGGPITGGSRLEGIDNQGIGKLVINFIDIILATLLILDEINVTGTFISSGEFTINVSGPIFGYPRVVPITLPPENIKTFNSVVSKHYTVPLELLNNLKRGESNGNTGGRANA